VGGLQSADGFCFFSDLVAFIELAISLSFELLLFACCHSLFYPLYNVLCFFAFVEFSAAVDGWREESGWELWDPRKVIRTYNCFCCGTPHGAVHPLFRVQHPQPFHQRVEIIRQDLCE